MASTTINRLFIDTPFGDRGFCLIHGDLCDEVADLLIFSAHAGNGPPGGAVLRALQAHFGPLEIARAGRVLTLTGDSPFRLSSEPGLHDSPSGVYALEPCADMPSKRLMMLRMPGAARFSSDSAALDAYRRAVRSVFCAVAALEFNGESFPTISLSVLGHKRRFDKRETVGILLDVALDWLRVSRHTMAIHFVVWEESELANWSQAMDKVLGRTFLGNDDYGTAAAELRLRLTDQIDVILTSEGDDGFKQILHELKTVMALSNKQLSIQHMGLLGRLVAEAMADRLCRDLGIKPSANAFGNIERLQQVPKISKWINSYLHSLRVLGNESVHLAETGQRIPRSLAAGDLVVIFGNLARVLDFYRLWCNEQVDPRGFED